MSPINFKATRAEFQTIVAIAKRAETMQPTCMEHSRTDWLMDITACHLNGFPLRLDDLLAADDMNFAHDVFGIRRHIDRETGKLLDCFLPRFADLSVEAQG